MTNGSERSGQMLAAALEKEEKGRDFYKDAAEKCVNQLGREFFRILMAEEGVHIRRIKDIYSSLTGASKWTDKWKAMAFENEDLHKLTRKRCVELGSRVKGDSSDIEALNIGLQMEQGAINFYEDQLDKSTDSLEKEFITIMIAEERNHYAALSDMKLYFTDPESWFIENEKVILDGA